MHEPFNQSLPFLLKPEKCKGKGWSFMGQLWRCFSVWREKCGSWALGLFCDSDYMAAPWQRQSFRYTELVQCLEFSLSCILPTPASISVRNFETGVFLYFLPIIGISPYVLKILDSFCGILGQKSLCSSKVEMMEKWHHLLPRSSLLSLWHLCRSETPFPDTPTFGKLCYLLCG